MDTSGRHGLVGTTLSHYRIISTLGAGGMGEVYRATDINLGRDVALKVLPAAMAADADRLARFQREARAVAALNHPNVVTIYSVEQAENVHFITMELIEGQSLDRMIPSAGFELGRMVEIAGALGEALAAAHEKGIVHRDLKPANVMVTHEGRVKVLDFGLAKDVAADTSGDSTMTSAGITQAGVVMGTPSYMSPEQVSGRALDHRTDIFSLGVMLHEMATGRRPFHGDSSAELISSILRDDAELVTEVRPDLPADLARIIRRCLEKDPRRRMQTARDVGNEFREIVLPATRAARIAASASTIIAAADSGSARAAEGFWIAVLPFKSSGAVADLRSLAEGISDEIITGLARFPYLRVIAGNSTARFANQAVDVRTAGKELGARYVMEGSIRHSGAKVRIAVQLVDAETGAGLWAETYDRPFAPDAMLDLLDDVVPRIVATVGDTQGILAHNMTEALRKRDPESLTPYEALVRSFGFHQHVNAAEHLECVKVLERAVEQAPDRADCWAMLSWLYRAEHTNSFNPRANSMNRALAAAQRAVSLAPASYLANAALASAFFFRHELGSFRAAADRALALNNMEGYVTAFLGMHFAYSGDWGRGCALAERATQLNPNHPGWYWMPMVTNAYRLHDSERALELALRMNMPGLWTAQVTLVSVYTQLGKMDEARNALRGLLQLRPDFASVASRELEIFLLPDLASQVLADLRKAGLDTSSGPAASVPQLSSVIGAPHAPSGETRAAEGFWVSVLPFKYTDTNADLKSLAEGLSDEVIAGLSRFSYLRVIARGATAKYAGDSGDIRAIGNELGARYVMEGRLRQAGSKLRLTVQLADTLSGAQLWAETYERAFAPDALFELQDDLVPRIVSTVADQYGVLPRSMSLALRNKSADDLTPHEAVLRAFSYFTQITPEEHKAVRDILERAVRHAPNHADAWAMLAMMYRGEFSQGYNAGLNPLDRALEAAQRAVQLSSTHALGHYALATVYFFRKEMVPFRVSTEKALALNRLDASVRAYLGLLIASSGEWDRGCQMVESAMQLNPNCPGYYHFAGCWNNYRLGNYTEALEAIARANMPHYYHAPAFHAAVLGQLGRLEEARQAVKELLAVRPEFARIAREEYSKWLQPDMVEKMLDGLRKAGLEIPDEPSLAPATPSAQPSIAVLPFANMSPDAEQEYFSDGLAEELINLLAQMPGMKVIARTSSFAFRGKQQDIRKIADALNVIHILEGSVRRSGTRVRVTAQLISAADGAHLWSERFDRELSDIFAVQDEIAAAIAKALQVKLSGRTAPQRYTLSVEAYEAYLKGKYQLSQVTPESLEMARQSLERAIELDPNLALAHLGLGYYYNNMIHFGRRFARETVPKARAAIQRALEIDASLSDAHALLGYLAAMYDYDWAAAEKHFEFPGARRSSFQLVRPAYAAVLYLKGRAEEAIELTQNAIGADPLDVWPRMNLHAYLQAADRDNEALEQLKRVLELDQNQAVALVSMAMIHAYNGNLPEALKIARRAYEVGQWFPDSIGVLAALLRRSGAEEESKSILNKLGSGDALGDAHGHMVFHLLCGEIDAGADWAQKAIEQRDPSTLFYLGFAVCRGLRASHRWPKIAKMLNLPVEA